MAYLEEANEVTWDLEPLVYGKGEPGVDELLDRAAALAEEVQSARGRVADMDAPELIGYLERFAEIGDLIGRAGSYASLRYAADTNDPKNGALVQRVQERGTQIQTGLLFFDLEWTQVPDDHADRVLEHEGMDPYRHYLRSERRYRPYRLSEAEEKILAEKSVSGRSAWSRLFSDLTSSLVVSLDGEEKPLEEGLSLLASPDRDQRRAAQEAVTESLRPGLKTRGFLFNTILSDKAIDDRLRGSEHWLRGRNLSNEASDESVQALIDAVTARYDIAQRWYKTKAKVLGLDRLADYDRIATVAKEDERVGFNESKRIVLESYASFSPELADLAQQFFDDRWIDAPVRPGKRPGAFCSYTVPSHHPYVFLNFTARRSDVLTMAHELGHGLHAALARPQGIFHQGTPLTLAETASVFGETVTTNRLLGLAETPESRFSLLAETIERAIATVFRQIAMNRFEHAVHTERRESGELSVDRFGELWYETQHDALGDSVEITDNYKIWWSYIPHFIGTPGYVYAYAYGQLLALAVYARYEAEGEGFVPAYIELLSSGGSRSPEELGQIVGCDLTDPAFWDGGLAIVEDQLHRAEAAAREANLL